MLRYLGIALICLKCAFTSAQTPQAPSAGELDAITARGTLLYEYDQAAWHATDAVQPLTHQGEVQQYVARKTDAGWIVAWGRFSDDHQKFLVLYEAIQGSKPDAFSVKKHDPPMEDTGFYLYGATAIQTVLKDFHREDRAYNVAVLPAGNGNLYVYILPAQVENDVYPLGGDTRYLISPDGRLITSQRRMHQAIIDRQFKPDTKAGLHTHILSDTPEDTDVFAVLTRHPSIPEYVMTCHFTYVISANGSITVDPKKCGEFCEKALALTPSFRDFREGGCPDLANGTH